MDKHGFHLGYMAKVSTISKEIPGIVSKLQKGTKGGLQGAAIGGVLSPIAAYISGDDAPDIRRAAVMGVMGGGVAGISNELAAPYFTMPGWQNRVKGSALRYVPGFGTAVAARKVAQKLDERAKVKHAAKTESQPKSAEVSPKRKRRHTEPSITA